MKVILARNVDDALILGLKALRVEGVDRPSRNGPVRVFPGPVTTQYQYPDERVIFHKDRDANPYFHFMESLWMLAGRNDVSWISHFSSNIANFSDDGVTFHGAYGHRWRNHFTTITNWGSHENGDYEIKAIDQLSTCATLLQQNKDDRRVVMQMWDPTEDLAREGKDFPCNVTITFRVNPYGKLDMTVFNRSNDMIWGAYGANAVHFSVLQEVMAAWVGVPLGQYWQVSTNFHAYHNTLEKHGAVADLSPGFCAYTIGKDIMPFKIVNVPIDKWFAELQMFMDVGPAIGFTDPFFKNVAIPMLQSWDAWKDRADGKFFERAMKHANRIAATDWRLACTEWLERRMK
jgi:thymidylate synthase